MTSFKIIASLALIGFANAVVEDCPCFSRDELQNIVDIDTLTSCRESHSTGSGLGIFQTFNDGDTMEFGYSITLTGPYPPCMQGSSDAYSNTGTMEQAETCAQFVRDRCTEMGLLKEY
jgi:hypothetical protein